jgi:riboflavin kinase/FMN adenylyltransferase
MQIVRFPEAAPPRWFNPVAALGNFDGLHRGHLKLLERVRRQAAERGGTPVAIVFDPHPPRVLRPDKAPRLLMTLDQKLAAFERAGMQAVVIISFTHELAQWSPEQFVEAVLIDWLKVAEVWVGANFLFGKDRAGTFTLLRAIGDDRGFRVDKIDPVRYKDFVVSSTRVRRLVEEGRVDEAAALLGHPYTVVGRVVTGDRRGRELGMPTANLDTPNELLPANGIYATVAVVDDVAHPAVTSVGVRPTIGDGRFTVETHLLDGPIDLYDRSMSVAFVRWIRAEARFEGADWMAALAAAMAKDAADARALFAQMGV